jgi:hypothetical protein
MSRVGSHTAKFIRGEHLGVGPLTVSGKMDRDAHTVFNAQGGNRVAARTRFLFLLRFGRERWLEVLCISAGDGGRGRGLQSSS